LREGTTDVVFQTLQRRNGQVVYLIDTPGFDDTHLEYAAVFKKIASFICTYCDGYGRSIPIGGMIYVQRITDMRMSGSSLKSLRIFEKICGERHFQDVVVVTTMWNSLKTTEAQDAATMREKMMEERPEFFGSMLRAGARIERYQGDICSGIRIVEILADRRKTVFLQLQDEMRRDATMKLEGTTAGRYIDGELANTRERYEMQKRELEECAEEALDDEDLRSEFFEQVEDCTRLVNNIKNDQESLSVTLEDMRNEQAAWCNIGHNEKAEDSVHGDNSARISELEHEVQGLKRVIEEQRVEGLLAQREGIERIEAAKKEIAEAKERDQLALERGKEKRAPQSEAKAWMRNFFTWRPAGDNLTPPRRADSMPVETKASRRTGTKGWKKRSRSKGRKSGKPNIARTYSDEHPKQPFTASQYLQDQHNYDADYVGVSESDSESESETEDSAPPMYTSHLAHSYTPLATSAPNSRFHVPPHEVSIDPTGTVRAPPPPAQPPLRRITHSAGPPYHQQTLRTLPYSSNSHGDTTYRG
jgi:hypothetical protein